jgi:hypothetical protein
MKLIITLLIASAFAANADLLTGPRLSDEEVERLNNEGRAAMLAAGYKLRPTATKNDPWYYRAYIAIRNSSFAATTAAEEEEETYFSTLRR